MTAALRHRLPSKSSLPKPARCLTKQHIFNTGICWVPTCACQQGPRCLWYKSAQWENEHACTARMTCLVLALVSPGPAQPDLVLPEMGCNVSNHPLHADALAGAVLSRHFAGQLWLQNQTQLLSKVAGQASCQCLTPTPHLHNRSSIAVCDSMNNGQSFGMRQQCIVLLYHI